MGVVKKPTMTETSHNSALLVLLHNEDLLSLILRAVSRRTESFEHALVCSRWRDSSPSCQMAVRARSAGHLDEGMFIRQIRGFPNITSLGLGLQSISCLSGFLLGAACFQFPQLKRVYVVEGAVSEIDDITGESISSFFKNCTGLEYFAFFRDAYPVPTHPLDWPVDATYLCNVKTLLMYPVSSVPESLGDLVSLENLCLGGTFPHLPQSLSRLSNLTRLNFQFSTFPSFPDVLDSLTALVHLEFNLAGVLSLPPSISALTRLHKLQLNSDNLEAAPKGLQNLRNLHSLELGGGHVPRFPCSIIDLEPLVRLELGDWPEVDKLPEGWDRLRNLRVLILSHFHSLKALPTSFSQMVSLEKLELVGLKELRVIVNVEKLQNLKALHLHIMESLAALPESVGRLSMLQSLRIDRCNSLKVFPREILGLPKLSVRSRQNLEALMNGAGNAAELLRY